MRITRRLEFDAGHRIASHLSQCRHLHGHRYALEITLSGPAARRPGAPDDGMVLDFSDVKRIAQATVVDTWDHAFLVDRDDHVVRRLLETLEGHKTVVIAGPPTAELLAQTAFGLLAPAYEGVYGEHLKLERVRLYETPNCWADASQADARPVPG